MSEHIEWAEAQYATENAISVEPPGEISDAYGNENEKWALVVGTGSSSLVVEGTKAELVKMAETILARVKDIDPGFIATVNTPGYLPDSEDSPWFKTAREAWEYLADELRDTEDNHFTGEGEEGYSATLNQLEQASRGEWADFAIDPETGSGTIIGSTPGYDGDHDLGKAYSVSPAE